MARIPHCCGSGCRLVATVPIRPLAWEPPYAEGAALKRPKKKKKNLFSQISFLLHDFHGGVRELSLQKLLLLAFFVRPLPKRIKLSFAALNSPALDSPPSFWGFSSGGKFIRETINSGNLEQCIKPPNIPQRWKVVFGSCSFY